MTTEKITPKVFWTALIGVVVFYVVTSTFDFFGRISGNNERIEQLEATKMNKNDADRYFNDLQKLLAKQSATWDQYMISNEKDKERILKTIETNQQDIKDLLRNQQRILRSANSQ